MGCILAGTSKHNPAPLIDGGLWRYEDGDYRVTLCHGCLIRVLDERGFPDEVAVGAAYWQVGAEVTSG